MKSLLGVEDIGIILSPDKQGEPMYYWDGGGIREVVVTREVAGENAGLYYLTYDGAMPGANKNSYWNTCLAKSRDLIHWEKCGVKIKASALTHPESNSNVHKDFYTATSPWMFYGDGKWNIYYLGSDSISPNGIPVASYYTLYAQAQTLESEWQKKNDVRGCGKHICFPLASRVSGTILQARRGA